jgi:hypothetical protein
MKESDVAETWSKIYSSFYVSALSQPRSTVESLSCVADEA